MMLITRMTISVLLMLLLAGCFDVNRAREPKLQISSTIQILEGKNVEYIFSDEIYTQIYGPNTELGMEVDRLKSLLSNEDQEKFEHSIRTLVLTPTVTRIRMLDRLRDLNGKTAEEIVNVFDAKQASEASRKAKSTALAKK